MTLTEARQTKKRIMARLPKIIRTKRDTEIALAYGVNIGLEGTGYQVRLRKSDCVIEKKGKIVYRARSLTAAVNWIHSRPNRKTVKKVVVNQPRFATHGIQMGDY